ncbi:hypothetical protein C7M84_013310 [Penaeus vannamei]|uniref:Uncharacterized protein n=1 Tax=Penaeus vannamei TaxID=6689 RepID=A0A3R7M6K8_PENVA|nr:hypothetical protein C7M84_013310 [Penaeus vannamei]
MLDTAQHYGPFTSELTRQHLTINPWGGGILWGEGQGGSDPHPQGTPVKTFERSPLRIATCRLTFWRPRPFIRLATQHEARMADMKAQLTHDLKTYPVIRRRCCSRAI